VAVGLLLTLVDRPCFAHLLVNNAVDVVVSKNRVVIDARISMTEVLVVQAGGGEAPPRDRWASLAAAHGGYLLSHLHLSADGRDVAAVGVTAGKSDERSATYHIEYPLSSPPSSVSLGQDCLGEFEPSDAVFVIRMRQDDQAEFEMATLHRGGHAEFVCNPFDRAASPVQATGTRFGFWATAGSFCGRGIWHILTGYDHLLFVGGLVLAAVSLWDVFKVVAAFTIAHSVTLTLCVLNVVNLGDRIVEPMISASIVFIAIQNVLRPSQSRGRARLAVAFGFGLFHGLGFAGGLKEAMAALPAAALWTALAAFSVGVEIGHQAVVLPVFATMAAGRRFDPGSRVLDRVRRFGSIAICCGGIYFLVLAIRGE
jgi:hypothetical protein